MRDTVGMVGRVVNKWQILSLAEEGYKCKCTYCEVEATLPIKVMGKKKKRPCGCSGGEKIDVPAHVVRAYKRKQQRLGKRRAHGMSQSKEYNIWSSLKSRCNNPNNKAYEWYGGRGVKVCQRWNNSFEAFYEDMGPRPSIAHSIDRVDNDGDYEPGNCRWTTKDVQFDNTQRAPRRTYRPVRAKSGHKGIYFDKTKNKYKVVIMVDGKQKVVGSSADLGEAVAARVRALKERGMFDPEERFVLPPEPTPPKDPHKKIRKGSSKYKGVSWDSSKGKWKAYVSLGNGRSKTVGLFKDEDEAGAAAEAARNELKKRGGYGD